MFFQELQCLQKVLKIGNIFIKIDNNLNEFIEYGYCLKMAFNKICLLKRGMKFILVILIKVNRNVNRLLHNIKIRKFYEK